MDAGTIQTIATVVISAGGAAFLKEVFTGLMKLKSGKAATEGKRRQDIVQQRDEAEKAKSDIEKKCETETARADREATNRRRLEEYVSELRRHAIEHGTPIVSLPVQPTLDLGGPHD